MTLNGEGIVMVDFWAGWCGPRRWFEPVFEQASQTHPDIVFGKVDTEDDARAAACSWPRRSRKPCKPSNVAPPRRGWSGGAVRPRTIGSMSPRRAGCQGLPTPAWKAGREYSRTIDASVRAVDRRSADLV
jgi:thiol-disulfide isomerase/thioredoxin